MKRAILIMLAIFAVQTATLARAETTYTVVLAGGAELGMIHIWLTPDGRSYVIDSVAPLEVGGTICEHSAGNPAELVCQVKEVPCGEAVGRRGLCTVPRTPLVRSRNESPRPRYPFAIETTSRKFASVICVLAAMSPRSIRFAR